MLCIVSSCWADPLLCSASPQTTTPIRQLQLRHVTTQQQQQQATAAALFVRPTQPNHQQQHLAQQQQQQSLQCCVPTLLHPMLKQSICCHIWRCCSGMSAPLLLPVAVLTIQLLLLLVVVERLLVWGLLLLRVVGLLRMQELTLRPRRCWHLKWSSCERWAWCVCEKLCCASPTSVVQQVSFLVLSARHRKRQACWVCPVCHLLQVHVKYHAASVK
jgi:hypothetical protein